MRSKFRLLFIVLLTGFCTEFAYAQQRPILAPHILEGTETEMLTPEYWISLQPDAFDLILTPSEIDALNASIRQKRVELKDFYGRTDPLEDGSLGYTSLMKLGCHMNPVEPLELPPTLAGDSLRVWLNNNINWLTEENRYIEDQRKAPWTEEMKSGIISYMNAEAIPSVVRRRYGIIVEHADIRFFPTERPGYARNSEMELFQAASLVTGSPVSVIHESSEGDFYYVESPIARGWVRASSVAIGSKGEILRLAGDRNFLVCTGHRVPVFSDPDYSVFHGYIYMSTTIPLIRNDRRGFVVRLPWRKPDGSLEVSRGYIRAGEDVHKGFLAYTKANVLIQMFKLLDQPYGWLDIGNKRACSTTLKDVLNCFGIQTGAYPSFMLSATDYQTRIDPSLTVQEKIAIASEIEPVITFAGDWGHIVMFLGKARNGKLYFIHQGGFGYTMDGQRYLVGRQTINWVEHPWYDINKAKVFTTIK